MSEKIQFRRGPTADREAVVLDLGEPGFDTDLEQVFVGDGVTPGGLPVGGIPDAPSDGTGYVRKDGAWAAESGGGSGIPDAPSDGKTYGRKDAAWEEVPGGGGSDVVDVNTLANTSGTVTLDFAGKSRYVGTITLGANVTTLAFANLPGAGKYAEYELHIAQDGTGSRTFAIPASHKALGGSDTAIAPAANSVTVLTASTVNNGTAWRYAMQESA